MLDWEAVKSATDDLLSAALLGIDWVLIPTEVARDSGMISPGIPI
jgi:hypothetical protein